MPLVVVEQDYQRLPHDGCGASDPRPGSVARANVKGVWNAAIGPDGNRLIKRI